MGRAASTTIASGKIGRRAVLGGAAASAAAASFGRIAFAAPKPLKIGVVGPITGQLAILYGGMPFVMKQIKQHLGRSFKIDGRNYGYEIVVRDSESDPNHASQVAQDLIFNEQVDVVTTMATPETVNSVSDQCEANGMPRIGTQSPLESFFYGRGAPKKGFQWTFNFFFGLHQQVEALTHEWHKMPSNKVIGILYPNDDDGQASVRTFPPVLKEKGWKVVNPGQFDMPSNYSAEIAYEKASKQQWQMTLGLNHALFELAFAAFRTAKDPHDRAAVRDAIRALNYKSISGPINFNTGPFPNTARTPLAISQWRKGKKHPLELVAVDNSQAPDIPVQSAPQPITYG